MDAITEAKLAQKAQEEEKRRAADKTSELLPLLAAGKAATEGRAPHARLAEALWAIDAGAFAVQDGPIKAPFAHQYCRELTALALYALASPDSGPEERKIAEKFLCVLYSDIRDDAFHRELAARLRRLGLNPYTRCPYCGKALTREDKQHMTAGGGRACPGCGGWTFYPWYWTYVALVPWTALLLALYGLLARLTGWTFLNSLWAVAVYFIAVILIPYDRFTYLRMPIRKKRKRQK